MTKLSYRFEFKYQLPRGVGAEIREEIKRYGMKLDRHSTETYGGYFVTSLYFDSFNLFDYRDKIGGFMERKKLRARIYEPFLDKSPSVVLEVKHKHESVNAKSKILLTRGQWDELSKKGPSALFAMNLNGKEIEKEEILRNFIHFSAKPVLLIRYIRKAFMNSENLRINFDLNVEACRGLDFMHNGFATPINRDTEVMEVKYSYIMPFWLGNIIKKYDLSRGTFSKYSRSLEAVYRHHPIPG